jgi:hypothetical protein
MKALGDLEAMSPGEDMDQKDAVSDPPTSWSTSGSRSKTSFLASSRS